MKMRYLFFIFIGLFSTISDAETVILNANESPPYWVKNSPTHGMGAELITAISKEVGLESRIEFMPLKRLINDTTNNDLGNPVFYINNQDFAAIIPIAISRIALYRYKPKFPNAIQVKSLNDLKGYRIGALSGTVTQRAKFEELGVHIETSFTRESLFKKLHYGRLDFVLEIDLVGQQTITALFPSELDNFAAVELPNTVSSIAIMLDKNYPNAKDIADRYRQGLDKIIKNGRYSEIIRQYYTQNPPVLWFNELKRFTRLYALQ
jgi:polar amino acid transport system substrate-binding protein